MLSTKTQNCKTFLVADDLKVLGMTQTSTTKVITTVEDFFWKFSIEWSLSVFRGSDRERRVCKV